MSMQEKSMDLRKVLAYTVYVNPSQEYFWLRIRLEDTHPELQDIKCASLADLHVLVDLLRNESNTLFDLNSHHLVVGWEPTGENCPEQP
ncbi:MAG: hypothetical protein HC913_17520 [Microscillaceae bacterium]|nr:hypothetical protein [Microscillaceae bacterium]